MSYISFDQKFFSDFKYRYIKLIKCQKMIKKSKKGQIDDFKHTRCDIEVILVVKSKIGLTGREINQF